MCVGFVLCLGFIFFIFWLLWVGCQCSLLLGKTLLRIDLLNECHVLNYCVFVYYVSGTSNSTYLLTCVFTHLCIFY